MQPNHGGTGEPQRTRPREIPPVRSFGIPTLAALVIFGEAAFLSLLEAEERGISLSAEPSAFEGAPEEPRLFAVVGEPDLDVGSPGEGRMEGGEGEADLGPIFPETSLEVESGSEAERWLLDEAWPPKESEDPDAVTMSLEEESEETASPVEESEDSDAATLSEETESEETTSPQPTRKEVRGALISTDSFTTSEAYNPLAGRTSLLGYERKIIRFGVSYFYDSNVYDLSDQRRVEREVVVVPGREGVPPMTKTVTAYEDQDVIGGTTAQADLTLGYQGGRLRGPGFSYSLVYGVDFYAEDSDTGTSTGVDHALRGKVGLRGGFTNIQVTGNAAKNSGKGFQQSQLRREAPRAQSTSYAGGVSATRTLATGSLEVGGAYQTEEFDEAESAGVAISGHSRWSLDGAWFYDPPTLGYTTLGLGVNYGSEEQSYRSEELLAGVPYYFLTPSLRARWAASPFTSVGAYGGLETRWIDGVDSSETSSTPVFGLDANWKAPTGTALKVGIARDVQRSISRLGQYATTTSASVALSQPLRDGLSVALTYRYEHADYESLINSSSVDTGRRENYHQFGASLNQSLRLGETLTGQVSLFYHFNFNASEAPELEYQQHIVGVRLGMSF